MKIKSTGNAEDLKQCHLATFNDNRRFYSERYDALYHDAIGTYIL